MELSMELPRNMKPEWPIHDLLCPAITAAPVLFVQL